jgi:hypothetical protein
VIVDVVPLPKLMIRLDEPLDEDELLQELVSVPTRLLQLR